MGQSGRNHTVYILLGYYSRNYQLCKVACQEKKRFDGWRCFGFHSTQGA